MIRKKTVSERKELKVAKKNHKLSTSTEGYEQARQELLKDVFNAIKHCNFGSLNVLSTI